MPRYSPQEAVTAGAIKLRGIVEADETFVLSSRKGERNLDRKARRRGGKASKRGLSHEQVPVLVAARPLRRDRQRHIAGGVGRSFASGFAASP